VLWLLAAALLAQTPETVREADVFAAGVDVEVVNVDVVVSDRQGRPVTGLGPEDFELRVDGQSVAVRYFAAPAPAEARPRERPLYLAIYLDRAFLRPGDAGDLVPGAGGGAPGTGTHGRAAARSGTSAAPRAPRRAAPSRSWPRPPAAVPWPAPATSTPRSARVPVRIAHDEILDVLGRHLEYTLEVDAERGARTVAVGVRDDFAPLLSTLVVPLASSPAAPGPAPSR